MTPKKAKLGIWAYYVEDCIPSAKKFKDIEKAMVWCEKFRIKHGDKGPDNGYWVDEIIAGSILTYDGRLG